MNVAVLRFPGSNCDADAVGALRCITGVKPKLVWHESDEIERFEAVVLPGGFTFGDYLRAGAIASRSPAIPQIRRLAEKGKPVLGICNGFQILVEAGMLPGALLRNKGLRFVCKWVNIRVENNNTPFTRKVEKNTVLRMPIAHSEGRFFAPADEVKRLDRKGRIVFRYVDDSGRKTPRGNPNGSLSNIAGLSNEEGNIVGMMPHPERASDPLLSPNHSSDGAFLFESMLGFQAEGK
jgi:phosphoribosylformylglycinamidine synthase